MVHKSKIDVAHHGVMTVAKMRELRRKKETTRPITARHMQVSGSQIGEAAPRGMVADGAVCKGNHQKAEGA